MPLDTFISFISSNAVSVHTLLYHFILRHLKQGSKEEYEIGFLKTYTQVWRWRAEVIEVYTWSRYKISIQIVTM